METLTGKRSVSVKYLNGLSEPIEVRALPVRLMPAFLAAFLGNDEGRLIELYVDRKPEWSDSLTPEAVEAILAAGEELNRDPFGRYAARTLARGKVLASLSETPKAETPKA
jgi:hypothetical protein